MTCGAKPPETESAYTLIGGKAGWRLTRTKRDDGSVLTQWRCADCWNAFKKTATPAAAPPPARVSLSSPPGAMKRR